MKTDCWYKHTLEHPIPGRTLSFDVPHDVFSTLRIDEGTLLLLDHLPERAPSRVLDMGCGYGALGLNVAARYPSAKVEMVDRDLLAASWSAKNAVKNGLPGVSAHGSLGFSDLDPALKPYDWILCNVPARIGKPFIRHLFAQGLTLLGPGGELRTVVIRDLLPLIDELRQEGLPGLRTVAEGPRHAIVTLAADGSAMVETPPDLYLRDKVELGGLVLERPFDFGGDDPQRLKKGLPVLLDVLPKKGPPNVLCTRSGYGQIPLLCLSRWPDARVTAVERDLLGVEFTRRNAGHLGLTGPRLILRPAPTLAEGLQPEERFELIVTELSPSAGEAVALAELDLLFEHLPPGGEALILLLEKLERDWLRPGSELLRHAFARSLSRVLARDGYSLLRLTRR